MIPKPMPPLRLILAAALVLAPLLPALWGLWRQGTIGPLVALLGGWPGSAGWR
ncbi:hypothetical protein [Azospirillum brasilense]|uniref:hypothetical protein n=1 Tax=Azospirillum brasilense TaxID=192 RepID=UPI001FE95D0D|nr:hypothetical protein [Azospirillum brasilense]